MTRRAAALLLAGCAALALAPAGATGGTTKAGAPTAAGVAAASEDGWRQWRKARDEELKDARSSYLAVVDHVVLKPGVSTYLPVGTPRVQISWRKEPPGKPMTTITFEDGRLDVRVSSTGESLDLLSSPPDEGWTTPDGMVVNVVRTGDALMLVLRDPQKDGFKDFKGLRYFPFNKKAIVQARFHPAPKPLKQPVQTTQESPRDVWYMGTVDFTYEGSFTALKAYCLGPEPSVSELFIPFLDATNGIETYAGGRYLEATAAADGKVTLDFNRAYNPYCARNHIFSCIKVSGRPVEARITAGETVPKKK